MNETFATPGGAGSPGEVFAAFLKLGLSAFGGPIAHLGYFRDEFVTRRGWLDEDGFAELVALAQFLPGPASSQVGFAIGLGRAGAPGAAAAWTAFTLPSAIALVLFAQATPYLTGPLAAGALDGLKIAAVAIVAQAVHGMAPRLAPDPPRAAIAVLAVALIALLGAGAGQILAILAGAALGVVLCRDTARTGRPPAGARRIPAAAGGVCLGAFAGLLLLAGLVPTGSVATPPAVAAAFYRAGALVFGGGHVVLPLLESGVVGPGWMGADTFLAGYGAAQAIPGPLFTFSAFLGAAIGAGPAGLGSATLALAAIFLPGLLILLGVLPFWARLRRMRRARAAVAGVNAAVVGILGFALYTPLFTAAIGGRLDFALALLAFVLLVVFRWPPWQVVAVAAFGGMALAAA